MMRFFVPKEPVDSVKENERRQERFITRLIRGLSGETLGSTGESLKLDIIQHPFVMQECCKKKHEAIQNAIGLFNGPREIKCDCGEHFLLDWKSI